jgi:hypothetical protein
MQHPILRNPNKSNRFREGIIQRKDNSKIKMLPTKTNGAFGFNTIVNTLSKVNKNITVEKKMQLKTAKVMAKVNTTPKMTPKEASKYFCVPTTSIPFEYALKSGPFGNSMVSSNNWGNLK